MAQPLATRMRPQKLSDVVGQEHLIGPNKILTNMVNVNRVTSMIFYGKPGIGKTSIAHALSGELNTPFGYFNAGVHAKKDLQEIAKKGSIDTPVIALIDEVHRLDKPKQDFLLMLIEDGSLIMIGATTENPYISINPALRSRSHIFELEPVQPEQITRRLNDALHDNENGVASIIESMTINDNALLFLAEQSGGDVRVALNTLELAVLSVTEDDEGNKTLTKEIVSKCLQDRQIGGDKDGDEHYNLLSAFQKSIRGSDADASLHYLGRLIKNGDLVSIIRRLIVISYEDIGLADPSIPMETMQAVHAAERVGFPEARIPLAHITARLALSPKSNVAYKALDKAIATLDDGHDLSIPRHLRDTHYKGAPKLGNGIGYAYPHDYPYNITNQQYLPDALKHDNYLAFRDESDTPSVQTRYTNINRIIKQ